MAQPEDPGTSIRAAARWLTTAFAAVGAVLAAGLQLGSLGGLSEEAPWRLLVALAAVLLALLGVGWVIVQAAHVLITPDLTWTDLFVNHEIPAYERRGRAQPLLRAGRSHLAFDDLLSQLRTASALEPVPFEGTAALRGRLARARERAAADPEDPVAERAVAELEEAVALCLTRANAWQSRRLYRSLIRTLLIGGTLTAGCLVLFAWATNPPPDPSPRVTKPVAVRVHVTAEPKILAEMGLGTDCRERTLQGFAIGGRLDEPLVAVAPTGACTAARLKVTPRIGTAVPLESGK
ncbi:hypothetical protein [Streptomyces sp. URMC 123]|uniref:hypothetical protein n=1 Tax=Streptomyces sp. URMC 123 TaxID=3423403 RepID=UPI003F1A5492